jgi:DNA-binding NtrC family response regulator
MTGLELLEKVRTLDDELPVILMTAFGTIETAVKAMKLGAFDYLTKPFEGDELIICVKRAAEHRRLMRENALLRAGSAGEMRVSSRASRLGLDRLVGHSPAMKQLRDDVGVVAQSVGTVLVTGESGSGKEVVARALHETGPRSSGPFLAVNCAALSESLLESELFGHERGAFTGAERTRKGRFELADQGTLLLDEISEISPKIQAKLLRILQERCFERVGSSVSIGVDVRVIATSNRDLPAAVRAGEFRQDLYFRLNVLPVKVPALRERQVDVPELAELFVKEIAERERCGPVTIEEGARALLSGYAWPGNVRELQNICERAVVLSRSRGGTISAALLAPWLAGPAPVQVSPAPALGAASAIPAAPPSVLPAGQGSVSVEIKPGSETRTLEEIERDTIVQTLRQYNGHRQKTAITLGIGVRTLGLKLKKWKELQLIDTAL